MTFGIASGDDTSKAEIEYVWKKVKTIYVFKTANLCRTRTHTRNSIRYTAKLFAFMIKRKKKDI